MFGLVLLGVGIAMMLLGDLGAGPWDVFHFGLGDLTGISVGIIILIVGAIMVVGFPLLGERLGVGTVLNVLVIGPVVDICLALFDPPSAMWARILLMLGGPLVLAMGTGFYIGGGLGPGPRDGLMTGIAKRGVAVWKIRTTIEVVVLTIGIALGGPIGIGTVWFTLSIGPAVQFFLRHLTFLPSGFDPEAA